MAAARNGVPGVFLCAALLLVGCKPSGEVRPTSGASISPAKANPPVAEVSADGTLASGTGVEREKPAPGKGNVQGKVLYNGKPAEGIEVKLAEKFSRFLGGASGATFTAKTDSNGEYLIKNVPPKVYEGLLVKVFDSDYYVFATSGILQTAKYRIEPDQTYFAPDTQLFKHDLKLVTPKAGSKVAPGNIEVKWQPYPDAAYYKFSIHADSSSGAKTEYDYIGKRVEEPAYVLDKPLSPGTYSCAVEAYNGNDVKLAESSSDIKFTVKSEAAK
jgi:hypothetical protein